jgi:hypothetical protein
MVSEDRKDLARGVERLLVVLAAKHQPCKALLPVASKAWYNFQAYHLEHLR